MEFSTGHNPLEEKTVILKTDDSGAVMLPEMLDIGLYRVVEVKSPAGYLLNDIPVEFEITKDGGWDKPLEIQMYDEVVTGKIQIIKVDSETAEKLGEGFEFRICAAEEIVTADGTTRLRNGEEAQIISTDTDGIALSKELYPGKYVVQEIKAAEGYQLSDEKYEVQISAGDGADFLVAEVTIKNKKVPTPTTTPAPTVTPASKVTPSPTAVPEKKTEIRKTEAVQTGDFTSFTGLLFLELISLAGIIIIKIKRHSTGR